jgi:hypothetical protein
MNPYFGFMIQLRVVFLDGLPPPSWDEVRVKKYLYYLKRKLSGD